MDTVCLLALWRLFIYSLETVFSASIRTVLHGLSSLVGTYGKGREQTLDRSPVYHKTHKHTHTHTPFTGIQIDELLAVL